MARTLIRWACCLALLVLAGCASLEPRPPLPDGHALEPATDTRLDDVIATAEAKHPGQSGFRLVREGPEAFAIRARSALLAGRSLDVQTYIWHDDLTGAYLAHGLIEAADRGVKVRLLVDDMDARGKNFAFAALDAHPNLDVRMFNPFRSRSGAVGLLMEGASSFTRVNRRMHNKTWIADNRIAIVGGRNLGDEYFGASEEVNFVDLDFAMIGPIVRDASASFDKYWNSASAYPMSVLAPQDVNVAALDALRRQLAPTIEQAGSSRYAEELRHDDAVQRLVRGDWTMQWTGKYRFVSDDPGKVLGVESGLGGSEVLALLSPLVHAAQDDVTIISPYFVPGEAGTRALTDIAGRGASVRVLTNSLAANDVAMVYGGYSKWREPLLEGGVRLWELKPVRGSRAKSSLFGSSGASLHTKALATDHTRVFVGSYNLDPRSTSLNCEQGVFVEDPIVAKQLETLFETESAGPSAWSVSLEDGAVRWHDDKGTYDETPEASFGRKFQAWFARVFPVSSQL